MRSRLSVVIGTLACALVGTSLGVAPALGAPGDDGRDPRPAPSRSLPVHSSDDGLRQTSDGVRGKIAPPSSLRGVKTFQPLAAWQVAPGVAFEQFDILDTTRGTARAQLLRIDPAAPGISIDYAGSPQVSSTAPIKSLVKADGAIAGVNGDFFDIGDTGAPLGLGRDRNRGTLHGPASGWNIAFSINGAGQASVGTLAMNARIKQHPKLEVTNVNSPSVAVGKIGVYTKKWGRLEGYSVTDGQKNRVRMVVVQGNRVKRVTRTLPKSMPVNGKVLIGRGKGASDLRRLTPGKKVNVKFFIQGSPKVAITGNRQLVTNGVRTVYDDKEQHPRTAIGIDNETGQILMLVIDGRQSFSRGYTMVELANLMLTLGADNALNLDGGGSSTMVAPGPGGRLGVRNSPSDGQQRRVPNGLLVQYDASAAPAAR